MSRHVIRHHHKKGEPHKAIEYCLDQVETRLANGGTFLHDTIKTHGALTTQLLAELQRLAAAAPGAAAAEGQTDETGAATPSTATSTPHFIPGTMKTNIGTLKSVVKFLRAQGDKPQVLFSFEAETGDESLETIEVRMPTLKNVCAPWADRKLTGPESFAALACDTALVLAAAPDAMFYLPPRINDIFFWSNNQRAWLDVMILDEFIYQIDPYCSLFITGTPFSVPLPHTAPRPSNARCRDRILVPHAGDKPKDDCVMGPSKPGEVRQNRSYVLLNKAELLGVGFKSANQKGSGKATFHGKTLADEIKALRGGHHVTVLVNQTPDSQAPPEYCVITPPDVEQFAKVARMGADDEISYYQLKQRTNLKFVPVADAAQQLVDAYEKYSRFASRARERRGRVVDTSPTQAPVFPGLPRRDGRHRRLARQEPGRARRGGAPLGPGRVLRALVPGRRQGPVRDHLQVPLPGAEAGPHGPHRLLRVHGQFDGTRGVGSDHSPQQNRVRRRLRRDVGQHGAPPRPRHTQRPTPLTTPQVDIWVHYFLAKKLGAWRPAAVFSTTAELLARTEFSILKRSPAGQFDKAGEGIFYVKDWKASSRASLHFDYVHKRDAAALAEHHHPSRSQFLRTVVVSPSKDSDQEVDRRKDLKRLFDLVVNEEEETPPEPKADWLATPRQQY